MTTQIAPRKTSREETALFPFTPFRFGGISSLIDRMRSDFDRMLNRFDTGWGQTWEENGASWGMDIRDEEDAVVVVAETPGFAAAAGTCGSVALRAPGALFSAASMSSAMSANYKSRSHPWALTARHWSRV